MIEFIESPTQALVGRGHGRAPPDHAVPAPPLSATAPPESSTRQTQSVATAGVPRPVPRG